VLGITIALVNHSDPELWVVPYLKPMSVNTCHQGMFPSLAFAHALKGFSNIKADRINAMVEVDPILVFLHP
jgi:hypothetical protein